MPFRFTTGWKPAARLAGEGGSKCGPGVQGPRPCIRNDTIRFKSAHIEVVARTCFPRSAAFHPELLHPAGWRMASTAMRLVILAACADTFCVLIDGRHFKPPLP